MDHQMLMCIIHCSAHLSEKTQPVRKSQLALIAVMVKPLSLYEIHDEVWPSVIGPAVQEAGNIWMLHTGEYLPFFEESAKQNGGAWTGAYQLDGNFLFEFLISAAGKIDCAHTAFSN